MLISKRFKKVLIDIAASRTISDLFSKVLPPFVPIFMLHRIENESLGIKGTSDQFLRDALSYLRDSGYEFIALSELVSRLEDKVELPKKAVCFTLDDGFWDQAKIAAPIFQQYSCPATFFLTSGFIRGDDWLWHSKVEFLVESSNNLSRDGLRSVFGYEIDSGYPDLAESIAFTLKKYDIKTIHRKVAELAKMLDIELPVDPPKKYRPIVQEDIEKLRLMGMEIGPHSVSHPVFANESEITVRREINQSKAHLDVLTETEEIFCYPVGRQQDFLPEHISLLRNAGLRASVTACPGYVTKASVSHLYHLPRFSFPNNLTDMKQYVSWVELFKRKIRKEGLQQEVFGE